MSASQAGRRGFDPRLPLQHTQKSRLHAGFFVYVNRPGIAGELFV